ncbi:glycoside hydrolase family 2 TIM barrel-domain containing protein [Tenacibaculum sp. IB213877]|uniref:glycoside hydrolase family 2 TIM barrel-domain containing protein n=1 Tax=Tenacibaculum sp. IB213877 TaxID=3097351 RepID=UPI002A5A96A6|nr:glycoside hydrolase family 2 TIM barrel-domain containing protein [Tenacibaculum sp. IB213877]MDY0781503.1 cellulase family glycosylhydrolase [Tenacibaculum sp. IB213877]
MTKDLNKNIYRALLIISFIALNGLILYGISGIWTYLNTGADRSSMLHTAIESKDAYLPKTTWTSLENPGRPIEEQTLAEVQKDYLNAWHVKNIAYKANNPYGIKDYYTDSAQVNLYRTINYNKNNKIHIEATTLSHQPKLEFYSADGQLVVFTDENVKEYQRLFKNNKLAFETTQTSTYKVMMLLEDGFWRIRHMVKEAPTTEEQVQESSPFAEVVGSSIKVKGEDYTIQGINYYPQKTPWNMFGNGFDASIINDDFKLMANAGLNTIRIFIQYEDFGKADVKAEKLEKLKETLDLAQQNKLKVIVTLFDFYGDYSVHDWTLTHRHAEKIVSTFKNHKAILAWDIKNEPDLDFESRGKKNVLNWLEYMMKEIQKFDSNHLITIGWSNTKAAVNLNDEVDLLSYHYYANNFEADFDTLQKEVPNKPLVLQEFGVSSYRGLWNPFGNTEKDQANYYKKMQAIFRKKNIAYMSWTLYDFDKIPTAVVGNLPWRKNKQKHFGFINKRGKKKPSFLYISSQ